jgi:hypothetical protein
MSLARIAGNEQLQAWDAKVARALRLDTATAIAITSIWRRRSSRCPGTPASSCRVRRSSSSTSVKRHRNSKWSARARFVMRVEPPLRGRCGHSVPTMRRTPTSVAKPKRCA